MCLGKPGVSSYGVTDAMTSLASRTDRTEVVPVQSVGYDILKKDDVYLIWVEQIRDLEAARSRTFLRGWTAMGARTLGSGK